MRKILAICAVLGAALQAQAAASYVLNCEAQKQGRVTVQLSSFSFQLTAPAGIQTGGGARRTNFELIVHFPAGKAYAFFQQSVETNEMIKTCTLIETENGAAGRPGIGAGAGVGRGGETQEWTFSDGTVNSTTATGSDGSGANANGVPQGSMQAILMFGRFAFAERP
jgi:hypothetical protein